MSRIIEKEIKDLFVKTSKSFTEVPIITGEDFKKRVNSLMELAEKKHLSHILVYGDREHYSNVEFLTKYDPRFEETILILCKGEIPTILVGNEGWSYSNIIPYEIKKELFQSLSLVGQPRGNSKKLKDIFISVGINKNSRVGIVGWKYFNAVESDDHEHCIDIPHYIVELLGELVDKKDIINANDLMISNDYGLRHRLDAKEIVLHEIAGTKASQKTFEVINCLREGMSEIDASKHLFIDGEPLSVHPNINFGEENFMYGLASPTYHKRLSLGDLVSIGMGYRRALTHRSGIFVRDRGDIPAELKDAVEYLYKPYFMAVAA